MASFFLCFRPALAQGPELDEYVLAMFIIQHPYLFLAGFVWLIIVGAVAIWYIFKVKKDIKEVQVLIKGKEKKKLLGGKIINH